MIQGMDPYVSSSCEISAYICNVHYDLIELDTGRDGEGSTVAFTTIAARKLITELESLIKEIEQGEDA